MKKMIGTRRPASCVALGGSEPNERIQSSSTALSPRYNSSPPGLCTQVVPMGIYPWVYPKIWVFTHTQIPINPHFGYIPIPKYPTGFMGRVFCIWVLIYPLFERA